MMQTVQLGDVIELIGGGTPKTTNSAYWGGDIPWISVVDFASESHWVDKTEKTITQLGLDDSSTKLLKAGDIIISARGTVGELAQLRKPMAFNQSCYGIRAREGVDQDFLYFLLKKSINDLQRQAHGGVFSTVTRSTFNYIKVAIPTIETQKKIADILGTLDEKIELNRKMNETLEQIGQTLFRHYFIDNAKNLDAKIALGTLIKPKRGKSLQSRNMIAGEIPVVSGGLQPAGLHNESNTVPPVIAISASGANAGFVSLWSRPIWSADSSYIDGTTTKYVYTYYLFLKNKQNEIYGMQTGSGQPHIYPKHIELLSISNRPEHVYETLEDVLRPIFKKVEENNQEIQTLTTLRDTLLPKLISGKIKLD